MLASPVIHLVFGTRSNTLATIIVHEFSTKEGERYAL